jgi:hypothetical protein
VAKASAAEKEDKKNPKKNVIGLVRNRVHHLLEQHFLKDIQANVIHNFVAASGNAEGSEAGLKAFTIAYNAQKNRKWTHDYSWKFLFQLVHTLAGGETFYQFIKFFLSNGGSNDFDAWVHEKSPAFAEKKNYLVDSKDEILKNLEKNNLKFANNSIKFD